MTRLYILRFFATIFLPVVLILTKIGEGTVNGFIILGKITVESILFITKMLSYMRLPKMHVSVPKLQFPKVSFPSVSFPKITLPHPRIRMRRFSRPKKRYSMRIEEPLIGATIPFWSKARYMLLGILVATVILIPFLFRLWLSELPNPNELAYREPQLTTKLYDREGRFLFQFYGAQNRTQISLSEIPQHVRNATIAIEDKNFYHHNGFDLEAIARAARETIINKRLQGGSTITQQLIKSTFLTPEISLQRKVKEVILAFLTERKFSKDQILEMYFNQVPYGGTAYGIEAASQTYFGKSVKELTVAEAALLAGLPSGPSIYSPFGEHPELATTRQQEVLKRMVEEGYITQEEAQLARETELSFATQNINIKAPHFVMYVKDWLTQRYGERMVEQGGLRVTTTLDLELQEKAQEIVGEEVARLGSLFVGNGAALITNPQTGEILAMIGSRNYFDTNYDGNVNVTTALRQPGSSIKLVTYAAALEKGLSAASILDDSPITYRTPGGPSYSPVNYDGRFHGRVTLREAFGNSYNVPAVKTLALVGLPNMIDLGRRMGITTWNDEGRFGLSLTLGGGEVRMTDMAVVYGVVATGGIRRDLSPILRVTSAQGEIIEELPSGQTNGRRVLSEGVAFILADILADNNARTAAFGPNSVLNIPGFRVSVKTGTTDSKRDNWTIGFTKDRVVAVWVGNNDNSPMHPSLTSGVTGAAPIWNVLIRTTLAEKSPAEVNTAAAPPGDVIATQVCRINGLLPCGSCPTRIEYFVPGTEPKIACRPEFISPAPGTSGAEQPTSNN